MLRPPQVVRRLNSRGFYLGFGKFDLNFLFYRRGHRESIEHAEFLIVIRLLIKYSQVVFSFLCVLCDSFALFLVNTHKYQKGLQNLKQKLNSQRFTRFFGRQFLGVLFAEFFAEAHHLAVNNGVYCKKFGVFAIRIAH